MKMFSDCSGKCDDCVISYAGCCIAGHGDDDFQEITEEYARGYILGGKLRKFQVDNLLKKFPSLQTLIESK